MASRGFSWTMERRQVVEFMYLSSKMQVSSKSMCIKQFKVDNGKVKIDARRETKTGENYDAIERFRTIKVPDTVEGEHAS